MTPQTVAPLQVLVIDADHARYRALLAEQAPDLRVLPGSCADTLVADAAACPVWLGQPDRVATLLRRGIAPRWLQSTWAGITPLLAADLPRDYRLSRAVGIFGPVMSEFVLCHLLAHTQQLQARQLAHQAGHWQGPAVASLNGQCALIVGTGDIGQHLAGVLSSLGMRVLGVASTPRSQAPFIEVGDLDALPQLAGEADYLINLLPDTPATRDLYDAQLFACCKPGALFINAGRGSAVVDVDLVQALETDRLGGAVIDVCREEPPAPDHSFWQAPRLLLTGHTAAPTDPRLLVQVFLDNLARWQAGESLRGEVDFARGY